MSNWFSNNIIYYQISLSILQFNDVWSYKFNNRFNLLYFLYVQELNLYFSSNQFITTLHFHEIMLQGWIPPK